MNSRQLISIISLLLFALSVFGANNPSNLRGKSDVSNQLKVDTRRVPINDQHDKKTELVGRLLRRELVSSRHLVNFEPG